MSSSFNPSITRDASGEIPRIHPGAVARKWRHGQMMGPNYGIGSPYVLEAGGNAAINAAMARQASQRPTAPFGGGIGKSAYQGAGLSTQKKGLSLKNMINAMSKMKAPTGEDFSRVSGRAGGRRPTAPSPRALGVDALEMASADDPRKKWWKQWQGLMGA